MTIEAGTLPKNVLYYGTDAPPPAQITLRAGPLSLIYESGDLRYIRLGRREILRRVYVALRDRNWGTVLPVLSNVQIAQADDAFQISYDVEHRQGEIDFGWRGSITGDAYGTIRFVMEGVARSTFLRNRIGFCVLHPIHECAGTDCRLEHVDGTVETTRFPQYIAPQALVDGIIHPVYPFANLRAIAHEVQPGVWTELRFDGETFEMEDQRNWTDASYKTYGTPLRLPFPAQVEQGTRITQSVMLMLRDDGRRTTDDGRRTKDDEMPSFVVRPSSTNMPLPRIGLGVASHGQPLSERELDRLRALHVAHLRVDLNLASDDYRARLRQAGDQARALGASLEVALMLSDVAATELAALAGVLTEINPPVHAWLIFHVGAHSTAERWVQLAREQLAGYNPAALIGGGTNANFTELNRARPPIDALDLLCYAITPQVHAFDNASLAETLAAQAVTVASARQFAGDLPLAITPITLLPRFNPNATGPEPALARGELPPQVDVRQMSLFGAGWTAGSLKYLCASGAASLTYYETTGWRGVMEQEHGALLPERFRSLPGGVFPLYHVLADIGEFAGGEIMPTDSSEPLRIEGLALRKGTATRIVLASLIPTPQRVHIQHGGRAARVRTLDERNAEAAMRDPESFRAQTGALLDTPDGSIMLELLPYAVVRVDVSVIAA
jgi:D-apionolactonase